MKHIVITVAILVVLLGALDASALIFTTDEGQWPATWPKELEPLRKKSKTTVALTGIQENFYRIPFETREEFEKFWPTLVAVRTPGSPLTLSTVGGSDNDFVAGSMPCVRIKGPSGGFSAKYPKFEDQLDLRSPQGELPEYVVAVPLADGKSVLKPFDEADRLRRVRYRARVDIELVIDGQIIDLNHIRLPADARIIDRRFSDVADSQP